MAERDFVIQLMILTWRYYPEMDGQCNHYVTLLRQEDQSEKRQYNKREIERGGEREGERERGALLLALEVENGVRSQGVQVSL